MKHVLIALVSFFSISLYAGESLTINCRTSSGYFKVSLPKDCERICSVDVDSKDYEGFKGTMLRYYPGESEIPHVNVDGSNSNGHVNAIINNAFSGGYGYGFADLEEEISRRVLRRIQLYDCLMN